MLQKLVVVCFLALFFSVPTEIYACRCKIPSTTWAYKRAEMVLIVKVTKVEKLDEDAQAVEVTASEAWKQNAPTTLKILAGGKVCGYFFEEGKDYIVYLKRNGSGEWTTANCVGNKVIDDPQFPLFTEMARQDKIWLKKNGKKSKLEK